MQDLFSSSSNDTKSRWRYDVFLNFRGQDTGKGFTDHLYDALLRDGIRTFRDDDEMESGGEISSECLKAIGESRFTIVVLSKGYASSSWCLEALVHILECRRTLGHLVWPIFYDVDPSHVEEIRGSFEEAFQVHQKNYDMATVQKWKAALTEISYLKGLDLPHHADGHEAKNIEEIVKKISSKLSKTKLNVAIYPVDLTSRAKQVISLLAIEATDFHVVGICGMGGIGKTSIAKEVFNEISDKFAGNCFLENVRQRFGDINGITKLQMQLLSNTLLREHEKIDNVDGGVNLIRERLSHKRVLIVLDDVDKINQISKLLGNHNWLFPGSRVIITTRIRDLLQPYSFYRQYEVAELDDYHSLRLLSLHAFDKDHPSEKYIECAEKLVKYAGGIPLALEVLGGSLRGEGIDVWNRRLKKLKVISNEDIHSKLETSYDALDDTEKSLFLDVACFFIGKSKDFVISILDESDTFPINGINVLMKRCLVKVDSYNKLWMHDLVRDMGREVVRRQSPKFPGKRSRLWRYKDVINVLSDETGTEVVEGLTMSNLPEVEHSSSAEAFKEMKFLRLLQLNYICLTGGYKHISKRLRWLSWHRFPLQSIPTDLHLQNLVALDLRYSSIKKFSDEVKSLKILKFLNLSYSYELINTPNFEGFSSLEKLVLKDCTSLVEVHVSIGHLTQLVLLNLQGCRNLTILPNSICNIQSLKKLNISGCLRLEELPEDLGKLKSLVELCADGSALRMLPVSIRNIKGLESLSLRECPLIFSPQKGPQIIKFLPDSLRTLDLRYCNIMDGALPRDLDGLFLLEDLKLCGNRFTSLPVSMGRLLKLRTLWLNECKKLHYIPQMPTNLRSLHAKDCPSLESINLVNFLGESDLEVSGCPNLKEIKGFFNFEPLRVDILEMLLRTHGSFTQELISNIQVRVVDNLTATCMTTPLQALSERGVYSVFLPGSEIPRWFSHQSDYDVISFRVPLLHEGTEIMGIAICAIYAWTKPNEPCYFNPNITIVNKTKMFDWMYTPYASFFSSQVEQDITWLCYWMFDGKEGSDDFDMSWRFKDELDGGDEVELTIDMGFGITVKKCGIDLLCQSTVQDLGFNDDLSIISFVSSRHHKRFLKSRPKWLVVGNNQEITSESYREHLVPDKEDEDFQRWQMLRQQKVDQTPDVHPYIPKPISKMSKPNMHNLTKTEIEKQQVERSSTAKLKAHVEEGPWPASSSKDTEDKLVSSPSEIVLAHKNPTIQEIESGTASNVAKTTAVPTLSDAQMKSKNLLAELSDRFKQLRSPYVDETSMSSSSSSLALSFDFAQQQRKTLADFLSMSVESIQQTDSFNDIERAALMLVPYTHGSMEKTTLLNLVSQLSEFKDSIPRTMAMVDAAQAQRESLQEKTKEADTKLQRMLEQLESLDGEFTKLLEEEMQVEAEIHRLMARKNELVHLKNSFAIKMEKTNEETSKDLKAWEDLEVESKQADESWLEANQSLAHANALLKLVKDKLFL